MSTQSGVAQSASSYGWVVVGAGAMMTCVGFGAMLSLAAALVLIGLRDSVVYFFAPSEFAEKVKPGVRVKLGGLVAAGFRSRSSTATCKMLTARLRHAGLRSGVRDGIGGGRGERGGFHNGAGRTD